MTRSTAPADPTELVGYLLGRLVLGALRAIWWLVSRPSIAAPIVVVVLAGQLLGWAVGLVILGGVGIALIMLRVISPSLFRRLITSPRARAKTRRAYRRRWLPITEMCGLTKRLDGTTVVPRLAGVDIDEGVHHLTVAMVIGQHTGVWQAACPQIAAAFAARSARVYDVQPGVIQIELRFHDLLADPLGRLPWAASSDLRQVPVGMTSNGTPWVLPLLGSHTFIGGVTGSGKSSIVWAMLAGVSSAIRTGTVSAWAVDPKGGMELGIGQGVFDRFACESTVVMVELLESAVALMDERCRRLAGIARQHVPTVDDPMLIIVVDELSTLTAYEPDAKLRNRATAAVSALLARGRAAAVVVIGCAQDPRKEVVSFRSLFPTRIAMRLDSGSQVDMVLGDGMHAMGARAEDIPAAQPGVGYIASEGGGEPQMVRASYIRDEEIRCLSDDLGSRKLREDVA
ncbi:FtsK/SpoIIIE domain-containing protein [Nakamurella aerolata]|uniref:Cell division protein FtsK n=1 Tax=Nakamurella aerolata TaxID=1656892 RepID=A0A849A2T6_9ACTN|nr:FtsK/SpoIIIE domain-containing protein [Nakamurella aerolata]NNG34919.1 cell division protein FtsK [Nakamurella aerolata]